MDKVHGILLSMSTLFFDSGLRKSLAHSFLLFHVFANSRKCVGDTQGHIQQCTFPQIKTHGIMYIVQAPHK